MPNIADGLWRAQHEVPDRNNPLGTQVTQRLLGEQGGHLLSMPQGVTATPVVVCADWTQGLASTPREARGVCARRIAVALAGGEGVRAELVSAGPGGLVVEQLVLRLVGAGGGSGPGSGALDWNVGMGTETLTGAPIPSLSCGGQAALSYWRADGGPPFAGPVVMLDPAALDHELVVPAGLTLQCSTEATAGGNFHLQLLAVWREVAQSMP